MEYNLKIGELLHKHFYGNITPEESKELFIWINSSEEYQKFYERLKEKNADESLDFYHNTDGEAAYKEFCKAVGITKECDD